MRRRELRVPLHGQELGPGITPLQARLGWVVGWDKGDFRGRAALEAEQAAGPHRLLAGLLVDGRRPPRTGQPIKAGDEVVGEVTSGNFSPMLEQGIAMAFLPPEIAEGDTVHIEARRDLLEARVVPMPFVS